jgi:hypothetical protein
MKETQFYSASMGAHCPTGSNHEVVVADQLCAASGATICSRSQDTARPTGGRFLFGRTQQSESKIPDEDAARAVGTSANIRNMIDLKYQRLRPVGSCALCRTSCHCRITDAVRAALLIAQEAGKMVELKIGKSTCGDKASIWAQCVTLESYIGATPRPLHAPPICSRTSPACNLLSYYEVESVAFTGGVMNKQKANKIAYRRATA